MPEYDLMQLFGYQVLHAAEWQGQKAKEFPADMRYQRAAKELEQLASEIEGLCGSSIEEEISDLDARLDFKAQVEIAEDVSRCLRTIGFYDSYETGLSLVEWYRDLLQHKLADR
jgi:hypothetical protein